MRACLDRHKERRCMIDNEYVINKSKSIMQIWWYNRLSFDFSLWRDAKSLHSKSTISLHSWFGKALPFDRDVTLCSAVDELFLHLIRQMHNWWAFTSLCFCLMLNAKFNTKKAGKEWCEHYKSRTNQCRNAS